MDILGSSYCRSLLEESDQGEKQDWDKGELSYQGSMNPRYGEKVVNKEFLKKALEILRNSSSRHKRCAIMLELRYYGGISIKDTARLLGRKIGTVSGELSHNRKALRCIINNLLDDNLDDTNTGTPKW